jgi:hypothetical protein
MSINRTNLEETKTISAGRNSPFEAFTMSPTFTFSNQEREEGSVNF